MAHAAQIARALLTDVADEVDGAVRLDVRPLERASNGEHDRETAAVVADTRAGESVAGALHGDVGPLGEHGVEMSGDRDGRSASGARPFGDNVADAVDVDFEAQGLEALPVLGRALGLF